MGIIIWWQDRELAHALSQTLIETILLRYKQGNIWIRYHWESSVKKRKTTSRSCEGASAVFS